MGASDLQVIFPAFMIIVGICLLSSFFYVNGNIITLQEPFQVNIPFTPSLNGTPASGTNVSDRSQYDTNRMHQKTQERPTHKRNKYHQWNPSSPDITLYSLHKSTLTSNIPDDKNKKQEDNGGHN